MLDWTKNCQNKVPSGHGDYRWGKILHDHLFVKNLKAELQNVQENQDTILELVGSIIKKLDSKKLDEENSDLFKK